MSEKEQHLNSKDFAFSGAFSGFITRFICQPLDVVKILFQLQTDPKSNSKYKSIIQTLRLIAKEEGFAALWKGHVPAQYLSIIFGAVQFTTYENFIILGSKIQSDSKLLCPTTLHFYAGGAAGVTAVACSFPFDTIRTRLVAQRKSKLYNGMVDAARHIKINEGIRGYFIGIFPAFAQTAPSSALIFGFEHIYSEIWKICFFNSSECYRIPTRVHFVTGLLAGITSKTVIYPLDMVKKRLQIQGMDEKSIILNRFPRCSGAINCLLLILKTEGFFGLYKGFFPAMVKAGSTNSIYFTVYHETLQLIDFIKR